MDLPQRFSGLPEYAFPRLRRLLDGIPAGTGHQGGPIAMSIGEPQHPIPDLVADVIAEHAAAFSKYPPNDGAPDLREAMAAWFNRRYPGAGRSAETDIMSLNGTREGLFNAALALCPETKAGARPAVLLPTPFYQCYAVAALAAGAEPIYVPATEATGFLPDYAALPEAVLARTAIVYICSPSNPEGAVADLAYWSALLTLAERYDFRVFADECYAELYRETPPTGIADAVAATGADWERVLSFHSLSKRSNLAGLRAGFVAGGPASIAALKQLRNYAGAPVPLPLQRAATAVWQDEAHVVANRAAYNEKFHLAAEILGDLPGFRVPEGGFFLWLPVPDGEDAARALWREAGVRALPGAYLSRAPSLGGPNPGDGRLRVALVAPLAEVETGLRAIKSMFEVVG